MRILLAPDCFGGTLSAVEAAAALASGWLAVRPADELVLLPLSDGGPGFASCLAGAGAEVLDVPDVEDPLARPTTVGVVLRDGTAWVESALACGLHLLGAAERDPGRTTTYGVGQLVRAAVEHGARRVVVGLGGSGTNDGGAGLLAALGLARLDARGQRLAPGGLALADLDRLVRSPPLAKLGGRVRLSGPAGDPVELVAATDVDAPLLGPLGASAVFGPQKGAGPAQVQALDAALARWADLVEDELDVQVRDLPGAGAAGGLGFALLALGACRVAGLDVVAEAVGLDAAVAGAELIVTGEGSFDWSSLRGKVVSGVASRAASQAVPCVVVAGQVSVGRREAAAAGVEASYSLAEQVGLARALGDPAGSLAAAAARVATQWSP